MGIIIPSIMIGIGIVGAILFRVLCKGIKDSGTGGIGYAFFFFAGGMISVGLALGGIVWLIVEIVT